MTVLWMCVWIGGTMAAFLPGTKSSNSNFYGAQYEREPYTRWNEHNLQQKYQNYNPRYQVQIRQRQDDTIESGRYIKPQTLFTISETLGALNTVGRYLVNMTRGSRKESGLPEELPGALYTISKNVLGRNVTDSIAPLVREALPVIKPVITTERPEISTRISSIYAANTGSIGYDEEKSCATPDGALGTCNDLSDCPQLLLNLNALRQSLCFKSLFVPGVCCPKNSSRPPPAIKPTVLRPISSSPTITTTLRPLSLIPVSAKPVKTTTEESGVTLTPLIVDPLDCGQPENAGFRVVGGEEAPSGKWPWMAAILLHSSHREEFWCGGSLISARHVLTAAHCTKDAKQRPFAARQFTVRLGDVDLKRDDEPSAPAVYNVQKIIAHPEFSRVGFYNDIALLVLDRPVRKSKYVIPLCLPSNDLEEERFSGKSATVVGWGTTHYGGKESTVQRQAVLPIWRNEDCNEAYFQPITSNFLCAGYSRGGTDACQGDSGGPLMISWNARWIQVGIVSFGNKCGEPGYPGVYTRVTKYLKWIQENLKV